MPHVISVHIFRRLSRSAAPVKLVYFDTRVYITLNEPVRTAMHGYNCTAIAEEEQGPNIRSR
jgi:hypothetical protein